MSLVPVTLRNATDTYTSEARPSENFAQNTQLRLRATGSSTGLYGWVYFSRPFPLGAQVLDAKLRVYVSGAWAANGSRLVKVRRANASWKAGRLTWSNQPGVTGTTVTSTTVTTGALADGTMIEFDVKDLLQLVSDGTAWYGLRIFVEGETNVVRLYSAQAAKFKPVLAVTYAEKPDPPTTFSPSGGRAVSLAKSKVRFDFTDPAGTTAITSAEIQLDAEDIFASGTAVMQQALVATTVPEIDLNAVATFQVPNSAVSMGFEETSPTGWQNETNATVNMTATAAPRTGAKHLSMTAIAAGDMKARDAIAGFPRRIRPSTSYTAAGWVRTAVTARQARISIQWIDAAGNVISTSDGTLSADSTTYGQRTVTATSPANAAFARTIVTIQSAALGEVHYWDDFTFDLNSWVGLADAETIYYRVRVTDDSGLTSDWSDVQTFRRDTQGTLAINNPAASPNNFVQEATPPITWALSGRTQAAWQVVITDALGNWLHTSGKVAGTATSYTLPEKVLHDGITYTVLVRTWDTLSREAVPGAPAFVEASRAFTYNLSGTVTAVGSFIGTDLAPEPGMQLDFTRATAPDSFTLVRDGKVIRAGILPGEVFVSGTSYRITDRTASPRRSHTWEVRAVVNGVTSNSNPQVTATLKSIGVWVLDEVAGTKVQLLGKDAGDWDMPEQAGSYTPVGGQKSIRIVQGLGGYTVALSGMRLVSYGGVSVATAEATLFAMKAQSSRSMRLVLADLNLPVTLSNVVPAPSPNPEIERVVSLRCEQSDDFPVALSI